MFTAKAFWDAIGANERAITPGDNQWNSEFIDKIVFNLLDWIPIYKRKNAKLLDVGCGEGRLMKTLASSVKQYVGVDISDVIIETAKKNAQKLLIDNTSFIVLRDEDISYVTGEYDIVVSFSVFMHLPVLTFMRYLKNIHDHILASGGYFAFQIPSQEHFAGDDEHLSKNRFDVISDINRFETRWYPEYIIASYLSQVGFQIVGVPNNRNEIWKCRRF